MREFDYRQLDEIIHSRIRLAIISVLGNYQETEFKLLKKLVSATDGNLSVHLKKLEEVKYIIISKKFIDRKPLTTYRLSARGIKAFGLYKSSIKNLIDS